MPSTTPHKLKNYKKIVDIRFLVTIFMVTNFKVHLHLIKIYKNT
jgi:hypothetical protein